MGASLRQLGWLLLLALVPAAISGLMQLRWQPREKSAADELTVFQAQALGKHVLWVDARARAAFNLEHIPDAVLLNEDEWDKLVPTFLDAWDPEKTVVVYCDSESCDASHTVARRLHDELQIPNVRVLKGGWKSWLQR